MSVPVAFVLQCIKQLYGKKVSGTMHLHSEFDGTYL